MKRIWSGLAALMLLVLVAAGCVAQSKMQTDAPFAVHFIDVGQADAALVLCDGRAMLIDGGNRDDSSLIYTYLKDRQIDHLDYIVATHSHEDHVGGLAGALSYATVDTALCSVHSYNSTVFDKFVSALAKQGKQITVPTAGDEFALGSARVQVLGPVRNSDDPNNMSLVLRIVYGSTSFLFTGDAEREEEQDILAAGYPLDSTVLKVGHHGSENSTTYPFLREIMPDYAVISVGEGNSYGHPTDEALSRLRDAGVSVLRTDWNGTVVCTSNGTTVEFLPAAGEPTRPDQTTQEPEQLTYILNLKTKKFHSATCKSVATINEENKGSFTGTRDAVLAQGYDPCGNCKP